MKKKSTFEQHLRKAGKWIGPGHEDGDTRVLKNIPPSKFARLLVMCKRCKQVSVLWMGDYVDGKSKCSNGCFRGRPRRSALPAPKKKEKTKKHTGKESGTSVTSKPASGDWSFGEDKTNDWWTFEEDKVSDRSSSE